jgi:hypothetical protein
MLAGLLGVIVGLLVLFGPLGVFTPQVDAALSSLLEFAGRAVSFVLRQVNDTTEQSQLTEVLGIVLGVATPGLVALLLVVAARASGALRNALVLVVGIGGLLVGLSSWDQGGLVLLALLGAVITLILVVQQAASVAAVALATILGVRWGTLLTDPQNPVIAGPAARLYEMTGFANQGAWAAALVVLGLAPFLGAALRVLKG